MADLKPGIYTMPAMDYHADPAPQPSLSNSLMNTLLTKTPLHAWRDHPRLNPLFSPGASSDKFDRGEAAHSLLLEGIDKAFIIDAPDWRKKEDRQLRDKARAAGKVPLLAPQHEAVVQMVRTAREYIDSTPLAGILERAKPEQTLVWKDTHIWCRGRLDLLDLTDRPLVLDYKTTGCDGPGEWMRRYMVAHGYDTQAVFYPRGLRKLGHEGARFIFLVQEVFEPFMCYLVEPAESMVELATNKISCGIRLWSDCIHSNRWPGYPTAVHQAEAPVWALKEEELAAL